MMHARPTAVSKYAVVDVTGFLTHIPTMRFRIFIFAAALALPAGVEGQGSSALKPLALPDGAPMRCAVAAASNGAKPLPPGHVKLEYYFGNATDPERGVTVLFDSVGRAAQLNELTFEARNGGELLIHGVAVAFDSTGAAEGFHSVRGRDAPPPSANLALPILTAEDRARARALADWLEKNRCDREGSKPAAAKPEAPTPAASRPR